MRTEAARAGALVIDSLPFSQGGTLAQAKALRAEGVDCFVGYLGAMNATRLGYLLDAGIAFMPVTFGMSPKYYSGPTTVAQCKELGLSAGCSVWLDLEGLPAFHTDPEMLIANANAWALAVQEAGFMPCLYVGVPQPLTSAELWSLRHVRYWHGQGIIKDLHNTLAAPRCGFCMTQKYPSTHRGGLLVDDNTLQADKLGRVPSWAVA